jgi:glycyl-tRNA synthetase beta chain
MPANKKDFLVEIHTEELPPRALSHLAKSFLTEIQMRLTKAQLDFTDAVFYATPRRLTVLVKALAAQQNDTTVERRGPAIDAAFDKNGEPSPACLGFARSCGVTPDKLTTIKNNQGEWVGFQQQVAGKSVQELLPLLVQEALTALPIPKRMRWGEGTVEFVRPVKAVILLYGDTIIDADILGVRTGRETYGHRFHCKKIISISKPSAYLSRLEKTGFVIADFTRRQNMIRQQAETIVQKAFDGAAQVVIQKTLLDEVTGLVEWPVVILGDFDPRFLDVPPEVLISAMQDHQRYFPVMDAQGKLMPHFVAVSNIEARNMQHVIAGNERVLNARLTDAAFFFETDKKQKLADRVNKLKEVIFHGQLGTLYDKAERLSQLSAYIAKKIKGDSRAAARAGLLAKADLTTEMVGEFPELQGIAGYYYALHDQESEAIAKALQEQYLPRFSGDPIPSTELGSALALADRLDSLVGAFGMNQQPTGDKDPFGLRRAALGVLRILIENKMDLDLRELVEVTCANFGDKLKNKETVCELLDFMQERLKPWYQEKDISQDVFAAVAALSITRPYDFDRRIHAVQMFKQLPDAESLSIANKRVSNILAKQVGLLRDQSVDAHLFEVDAERELATRLTNLQVLVTPLYNEARYVDVLSKLADLRKPVDAFFDNVMVMTEDKALRENRLLLLFQLRALFLQVADVALLQTRSACHL